MATEQPLKLDKADFFEDVFLPDEEMNRILGMGRKMTVDVIKKFGVKFEIHGPPKVGKTRWALDAVNCVLNNPQMEPHLKWLIINEYITLPKPVFLIDTEKRSNRLFNVYKDLDIFVWNVRYPDRTHKYREDPVQTLELMWKILLTIRKKFNTGTIVLDTHTYINKKIQNFIQNELVKKQAPGHELGEFVRLMPQDYSVRNDIWDYTLGLMLDMPQHVIFVSRDKEEWGLVDTGKGEKKLGKTGDLEPTHYKQLPYEVDVELNYGFDESDKNNPLAKLDRVMQLEEFAWSGANPEQKKWIAPSFTQVLNYVTKYSHRVVLKENLSAVKAIGDSSNSNQKQKQLDVEKVIQEQKSD